MDRISVTLVSLFCALKLLMHLLADGNSGFQGDELLHIEAGNHLSFGYNEFPPLIGLLAFIQNLIGNNSVATHHLFSHIASVLIMIYVAKSTLELGGKYSAVLIALICILIAPGFGRSQQLFQPVVFSQLFWVLSAYQLIRYLKYNDGRFLWYLTIFLALAFLTKYDVVFLLAGLPFLFFFKEARRKLFAHRFWVYVAVFFLLISPNIIWQVQHNFRVLDMMQRLKETQLQFQTPGDVLIDIFLALNPLTILIYIPALLFAFHKKMRRFRPLALVLLISILLLGINQAKAYYFFPASLILLPFGALYWEKQILTKKKVLLLPLAIFLGLGSILIPFGLPITNLNSYIENEYQYEKTEVKGSITPIKFQERYSEEYWSNIMNELKNVHLSLSKEEQEETLIWGKHYAQAGAVALFGKALNLPNAFSLHGSFYNWLPTGPMPEVIIAFRRGGANDHDFFSTYYQSVVAVKRIFNPYSNKEKELWTTIYICRQPKQSFETLRYLFKDRIYE